MVITPAVFGRDFRRSMMCTVYTRYFGHDRGCFNNVAPSWQITIGMPMRTIQMLYASHTYELFAKYTVKVNIFLRSQYCSYVTKVHHYGKRRASISTHVIS